jgi:hypothetical protein
MMTFWPRTGGSALMNSTLPFAMSLSGTQAMAVGDWLRQSVFPVIVVFLFSFFLVKFGEHLLHSGILVKCFRSMMKTICDASKVLGPKLAVVAAALVIIAFLAVLSLFSWKAHELLEKMLRSSGSALLPVFVALAIGTAICAFLRRKIFNIGMLKAKTSLTCAG